MGDIALKWGSVVAALTLPAGGLAGQSVTILNDWARARVQIQPAGEHSGAGARSWFDVYSGPADFELSLTREGFARHADPTSWFAATAIAGCRPGMGTFPEGYHGLFSLRTVVEDTGAVSAASLSTTWMFRVGDSAVPFVATGFAENGLESGFHLFDVTAGRTIGLEGTERSGLRWDTLLAPTHTYVLTASSIGAPGAGDGTTELGFAIRGMLLAHPGRTHVQVPEPETLLIAGIGLLTICRRRARNGRGSRFRAATPRRDSACL